MDVPRRAFAAAALALLLLAGTAQALEGASDHPAKVSAKMLQRLDRLIGAMEDRWASLDEACDARAPFALLYLAMTEGVRDHVARRYFDHGNTIAQMALDFAGRYHRAFDAWDRGDMANVSGPWREAFAWAASANSTVLEDVFLGMNAHINFDLGLVAWQLGMVEKGRKDDYDRINDVMANVSRDATQRLADHYDPSMAPGEEGSLADAAVLQVLYQWRESAWQQAVLLTSEPDDDVQAAHMEGMEGTAVLTAKLFQAPKSEPTAPDRLAYCRAHP
jgi:hypothetical protein